MDCLLNYIGLEQCNDGTEPDSGLYINSLPGIDVEVLQKISTSQQGTYNRVWESIQRVSGLRFLADVMSKLRVKYRLKTVRTALEFIPATTGGTDSAGTKYRGMHFRFSYSYHTFQAFIVSELMLVADTAGATALRIFDKYGNVLFSKDDIAAVEGMNRVRVDRSFAVDEIYIAFDFTNIDGRETSFAQDIVSGFWNNCQSCGWCMDCNPIIEGFTSADGITFSETNRETHGMGIIGFLGCDYKTIICNNKELFSVPWMFILGNQIMVNVLSSPRSNQATTVDRTKYEELRDHYQLEYEKQIENAIAGYLINTEADCCVECNENPEKVEWLP